MHFQSSSLSSLFLYFPHKQQFFPQWLFLLVCLVCLFDTSIGLFFWINFDYYYYYQINKQKNWLIDRSIGNEIHCQHCCSTAERNCRFEFLNVWLISVFGFSVLQKKKNIKTPRTNQLKQKHIKNDDVKRLITKTKKIYIFFHYILSLLRGSFFCCNFWFLDFLSLSVVKKCIHCQ